MPTTTELAVRPITITRRTFGYVVTPGVFRVDVAHGEGPGFILRNRCPLAAKVTFPARAILDADGNPVTTPLIIDPRGDRSLKVNLGYGAEWFEYIVYIEQAQIEATAASRPGIEIIP